MKKKRYTQHGGIKIDLKKSTAGFPLATKAMLGSSVLNSEKYPFMEFKSTNISKKGVRYEINGLLNLRGLKKNVTIFVCRAPPARSLPLAHRLDDQTYIFYALHVRHDKAVYRFHSSIY